MKENKKTNIIIDCDPGIDDAIALALAIASMDKLNILGITTVTGNQTIENVTDNALKLCKLLGADIPVARGAEKSLIRDKRVASKIHGKSGLGETEIPMPQDKIPFPNGVKFIYDTICSLPREEKITLVPIGPLTNIAVLLKAFPEIAPRIEEICLMGGGIKMGNITPLAEFNFWADPESAKIVLDFPIKKVMAGLNVTSKTGLKRAEIEQLMNSGSYVLNKLGEMAEFYLNSPAHNGSDLALIHDAVAVMYLLEPELFITQQFNVTVDTSYGDKRGSVIENSASYENEVSVIMD
ncbi:MAG: nucleoside hydrolase, partial [Oscillospiraceae bacterium]